MSAYSCQGFTCMRTPDPPPSYSAILVPAMLVLHGIVHVHCKYTHEAAASVLLYATACTLIRL